MRACVRAARMDLRKDGVTHKVDRINNVVFFFPFSSSTIRWNGGSEKRRFFFSLVCCDSGVWVGGGERVQALKVCCSADAAAGTVADVRFEVGIAPRVGRVGSLWERWRRWNVWVKIDIFRMLLASVLEFGH